MTHQHLGRHGGILTADPIFGTPGDDNLNFSTFNDPVAVYGLAGNDTLGGGSNSDLLDGGSGNDLMVGARGMIPSATSAELKGSFLQCLDCTIRLHEDPPVLAVQVSER